MKARTKDDGGRELAPSVLIDNLEVCRILGVQPDTWRKRVQQGTVPIPHSRMGNRTYYRRGDIRHFIRTGRWPASAKFRNAPRPAEQGG